MITPALPRWVAGLLNDPTTGVNALAPWVPKRLTDPEAPPVGIYNAVDDAWVTRKHADDEATPDEWVIAVRIGEELQIAGAPGTGSAEDSCSVVIELQGVTDEDADNAVVLAMAFRIGRAIRRCLNLAFVALEMDALQLEGQQITLPEQIAGFTLDGKSGTLSLALVLPFTLTDTWALSAEETP